MAVLCPILLRTLYCFQIISGGYHGTLYRRMSRKSDLTGMRFGKLTAIEPTMERKNGYTVWICRCDCGNTVHAASRFLKNGWLMSCGCRNMPFAAKHFVEGTCLENIRSRRVARNNTSGVRGVYKSERSGKWCAQITFQGKTRFLGSFATLEEAAQARKKGEQLFDEFLARYDLEHPDRKEQTGRIPQEEVCARTRQIVQALHADAEEVTAKIPV